MTSDVALYSSGALARDIRRSSRALSRRSWLAAPNGMVNVRWVVIDRAAPTRPDRPQMDALVQSCRLGRGRVRQPAADAAEAT
jgi:hypothetical protein